MVIKADGAQRVYGTISSALAATEDGSVGYPISVLVGPGRWNESISLSGRSWLSVSAPCRATIPGIFVSSSQHLKVSGFDLEASGASEHGIFVQGNSVKKSSDLELSDLVISGFHDGAGIKINGDNERISIVNSTVMNNGTGIQFSNHTGGPHSIESSVVKSNTGAGIEIAHGQTVALTRNKIFANGRHGVVHHRSGKGNTNPTLATLKDNEIYGNSGQKAAVSTVDLGNWTEFIDDSDAGNATTYGIEGRGSRVHPSIGNGCHVNGVVRLDATKGGSVYDTIQDAVSTAPSGSEIRVGPGYYNEVVAITGRSDLTILGACTGPSTPSVKGFSLKGSTDITIDGFSIDGAQILAHGGSLTGDSGSGPRQGLTLVGDRSGNRDITMRKVTVKGLAGTGILVGKGNLRVSIENSTIQENSANGIVLLARDAEIQIVRGTTVKDNGRCGISLVHGAYTLLERNDIRGNGQTSSGDDSYGICVTHGSELPHPNYVLMVGNRVVENHGVETTASSGDIGNYRFALDARDHSNLTTTNAEGVGVGGPDKVNVKYWDFGTNSLASNFDSRLHPGMVSTIVGTTSYEATAPLESTSFDPRIATSGSVVLQNAGQVAVSSATIGENTNLGQLTVTQVAATPGINDALLRGPAFLFGTAVDQFSSASEITLKVSQQLLDSTPKGQLTVYHFDSSTGTWVDVGGAVNSVGGTITTKPCRDATIQTASCSEATSTVGAGGETACKWWEGCGSGGSSSSQKRRSFLNGGSAAGGNYAVGLKAGLTDLDALAHETLTAELSLAGLTVTETLTRTLEKILVALRNCDPFPTIGAVITANQDIYTATVQYADKCANVCSPNVGVALPQISDAKATELWRHIDAMEGFEQEGVKQLWFCDGDNSQGASHAMIGLRKDGEEVDTKECDQGDTFLLSGLYLAAGRNSEIEGGFEDSFSGDGTPWRAPIFLRKGVNGWSRDAALGFFEYLAATENRHLANVFRLYLLGQQAAWIGGNLAVAPITYGMNLPELVQIPTNCDFSLLSSGDSNEMKKFNSCMMTPRILDTMNEVYVGIGSAPLTVQSFPTALTVNRPLNCAVKWAYEQDALEAASSVLNYETPQGRLAYEAPLGSDLHTASVQVHLRATLGRLTERYQKVVSEIMSRDGGREGHNLWYRYLENLTSDGDIATYEDISNLLMDKMKRLADPNDIRNSLRPWGYFTEEVCNLIDEGQFKQRYCGKEPPKPLSEVSEDDWRKLSEEERKDVFQNAASIEWDAEFPSRFGEWKTPADTGEFLRPKSNFEQWTWLRSQDQSYHAVSDHDHSAGHDFVMLAKLLAGPRRADSPPSLSLFGSPIATSSGTQGTMLKNAVFVAGGDSVITVVASGFSSPVTKSGWPEGWVADGNLPNLASKIIDTSTLGPVSIAVAIGNVSTSLTGIVLPQDLDSPILDDDGDGVQNASDNCAIYANPDQTDRDLDGIGDRCDSDVDGDVIGNTQDNAPWAANSDQADADRDGVGDAGDNCPTLAVADDADLDGDGLGDPCDTDDDGDGVVDITDNAPRKFNPGQEDSDSDSIADVIDNCPVVANMGQLDMDNDGSGDFCDQEPIARMQAPSAMTTAVNFTFNPSTVSATSPQQPIAVDINVDPNNTGIVVLDASKSWDPQGDAMTFNWRITDATNEVMTVSGQRISVALQPGHYEVTLVARDAAHSTEVTQAIDVTAARLSEIDSASIMANGIAPMSWQMTTNDLLSLIYPTTLISEGIGLESGTKVVGFSGEVSGFSILLMVP